MKNVFNRENLNLQTVLVFFLIVVSLVLISLASSYAIQVKNNSFRTFSVSAEGKAIATPDVAQFTFTVFTRGGIDVAESERANSQRVNQVMSFLRKNNIPTDDIKTESYNVEPRYTSVRCESGICPPSEIEGYTVSQTNSVKVRNFSDVSELLTGVASLNVDNLSQLQFVVDDKIEYENMARAEAISVAEQKAQGIARAAGIKLGRITSIYEDNYYVYDSVGMGGSVDFARSMTSEVMPMMDALALDQVDSPELSVSSEINPGTSEIKVRMTLNYAIR
jgi:uncharacterized protein YggE